jgi:signal transduction histidine kinase
VHATVIKRLRARLEASLARSGLTLPWWVPVGAAVGIVFAIVALAQRGALLPPTPLALTGLLEAASILVWAVTGEIAPPWLKSSTIIAAVAIQLTHPVVPDFAPIVLVFLTAEMAAIARPRLSVVVAGVSIAVLGWAGIWSGLVGYPVYIVAVLLGYTAGCVLRWYVRALDAERGKQDAVREQAVLAERQRIAREVHDVVAHSLSITLLHLTGARRALQQDRDVDEAVDGLTEAERVGRVAMADIRRAVGLLARTPAGTRPLPGADDIAGLVERTRAAGVDVHYEQQGEPSTVGASAGLGLYRIAQESLANIAKHAPDATARIHLHVDQESTRLIVRNGLPATCSDAASGGAGLPGMRERAAQLGADLSAGPLGGQWVVDITVPCPQSRTQVSS